MSSPWAFFLGMFVGFILTRHWTTIKTQLLLITNKKEDKLIYGRKNPSYLREAKSFIEEN